MNIGSISSLSGAASATTAGARAGAQAAVKWINSHCGLNGHPIKLFVEDSASDPTRYAGILKRLVEQEGVVAFFGNFQPLEGDAGVKYLNEKRVPLIGGDGWSSFYCQGGMFFYTGPCLKTMVAGTVQHAARTGRPKVAVMYCGEASLCREYAAEANSPLSTGTGGEIVYSKQISMTQPDFTSECLAAKDNGAQAITFYVDAGTVSRVARSCADQGYHPLLMAGGAISSPGLFEDPNVGEFYATYNVVPWVVSDLPAAQTFRTAIKEFGDRVWPTSAVSWADGMLLRAASSNLPANAVTSEEILNGLYSLKGETLGGLILPATFSPDQRTRGASCFFPLAIDQHKWVAPNGANPQCLE